MNIYFVHKIKVMVNGHLSGTITGKQDGKYLVRCQNQDGLWEEAYFPPSMIQVIDLTPPRKVELLEQMLQGIEYSPQDLFDLAAVVEWVADQSPTLNWLPAAERTVIAYEHGAWRAIRMMRTRIMNPPYVADTAEERLAWREATRTLMSLKESLRKGEDI